MDNEEFDRLLSQAGITRKIFDDKSRTVHSASHRLIEASQQRELILSYSPEKQCLVSFRKSVTIAIVTKRRWIREIGREYAKGGKPDWKLEDWSFSGTPGWNQLHDKAAVVETKQETGLTVTEDQFKFFKSEYWERPRKSRMYYNLMSQVLVCPLILEFLTDPDLPDESFFKDDDRKIHYRSYPPQPPYMIGLGNIRHIPHYASIRGRVMRDWGDISTHVPPAFKEALTRIDERGRT